MAEKSIIIIGAGIAGLSAGCYARMNGYETKIFEMHDKPGGLCTAWVRNGYTFDGSCHWVVGSNPKSGFNTFWRELGITKACRFAEHDEFARIEGADGKVLKIYADPDRLEKHMIELAPEDTIIIKELTRCIRLLKNMDLPVGSNPFKWLWSGIMILPCLGVLSKYSKMPFQEFARQFKNQFLREALLSMFDSLPDCPAIIFMMPIAWMAKKDAGHPIGGSLKFARTIEKRFLGLGGEIQYKKKVKKIIVENNKASGVIFEDGSQERADIVISAGDGRTVIFDMLGERYIDDKIRGFYKELSVWPATMQISLGVARDFSKEPHSVSWVLEKPVNLGGKEQERMGIVNYFLDPEMALPGKTCVIAMLDCDYNYWKELSKTPSLYQEEKKKILGWVIDELEKRYPGIKGQIEATDVATPVTYERYTGNQNGSIQGWAVSTKINIMSSAQGLSKTLPGLENFYMIGQWVVTGGGIPTGAMHGRGIVQLICKKDKRNFKVDLPH